MPILLNKTQPDLPDARCEKPLPLLIGAAEDADLQLSALGVSNHHCWIERHADGFHLVDLNTTNGSFVNGRKVSDALLRPGDVLRLGKVELEFQLTEAEQRDLAAASIVSSEPSQLMRVEPDLPVAGEGGGGAVDFARRCQQCGAPILGGANFCARCGLPSNAVGRPVDQFVQPVEGVGIRGPGILPMLALICGLVGPLLLGVGWLLGIVLGLMALGVIRRTGGFERDRRQAIWGVTSGIAWAVILFVGIGGWWLARTAGERHRVIDAQIAGNERAALTELANIARAEKYAKTILFSDANHNGIGEYLKLDQLDGLDSPFVNHALVKKAVADGYRFQVEAATEERFLAVAEPQQAGRTGSRVFTVDQTGVVRGGPIGAGTKTPASLPPLQVANAFSGADDEIAEDALAVARSMATAGDYEKSREVLDDLRQHYTLTKAGQQLTDMEKTIDPFLAEARADKKYSDALAAKQRGDLVLAVALLHDIESNYATFSRIHEAVKLRQDLDVQYAQSQEDKAKTLFEKAEALERDGKVAEAETIYFQIERGYPDTDWAKQVLNVKPALQRQLRENQVQGWLQQLASLSPETDYTQILNLVDQLRRNYSDTDAYRAAAESTDELQSLNGIEQKALAQRLKVEAFKQEQAGQTRRALAILEKAVTEKPDLTVYLRDTLWDLYPRMAQELLKEHDVTGALALYDKFLQLNPPESKLNRPLLARLSYEVAQSDLLSGKPESALARLQQAESVYRADPEFNTVYGRVLCRLGKYETALERLDAAVSVVEGATPATTDASPLPGKGASTESLGATLYFWRAWAWLHWAEELEAKVRESAELPTLAQVQGEVDQARAERVLPNSTDTSSTNAASPTLTNITISIAPAASDSTNTVGGVTTNVFETLQNGSLELVGDIEAARVVLYQQDLTSRGKGDKVEVTTRFDKAQKIQHFLDRVSRLRQLLLGEREHQRTMAEDLQHLLDAYTRTKADLETAARLNETKNPLLAQNARLVIPKITERAQLYREIVPALIRVRSDDLDVTEKSLDLAEQSINQLQWNLKGGLSISKVVEENFRHVGSRRALDEAVAEFHRFDERKLDLAELWGRHGLPVP